MLAKEKGGFMSAIFRKLSIVLCCLFGLISINPVTLANNGDYLVYFLGRGENTLKCGNCQNSLLRRSGQFCCPNHCHICADVNVYANIQGNMANSCKCGVNDAFLLLRENGPFCFIKYENGGDINIVFENAKKSNQLYCAYCMAKELNGNFNGRVSSNVPSKVDYKIPDDVRIRGFFKGKTCTAELNEAFKLGNHIPDGDSRCRHCLRAPSPYTEIASTMAALRARIW